MKILSPARTIDDLYFLCFQGLKHNGFNLNFIKVKLYLIYGK